MILVDLTWYGGFGHRELIRAKELPRFHSIESKALKARDFIVPHNGAFLPGDMKKKRIAIQGEGIQELEE